MAVARQANNLFSSAPSSALTPHQPAPAAASSSSAAVSPPSASSSNNTFYLMSGSPAKPQRKGNNETYRPKIITTVGAKPACLVNASVTYVGNDQIYAFGGFDQYTDEVYNHVLKLDLKSRQWSLVNNFGDIPGVRMGHTACLWQGNKLLVFGGENEHRVYLSDVIVFDLATARWTQPETTGPAPRGRARHAGFIHDEKLYILGGMTGSESYVLDDISYLDLKTWTWSRSWRFVPRYDHTAWVWGGRIWVFGGLGEEMERTNEIWCLDLRGTPAFDSTGEFATDERRVAATRFPASAFTGSTQSVTGSTGYAANSSSVTANSLATRQAPFAPGSISSVKFLSSPNLAAQSLGTHFHSYTSGWLLDFVTPASVMSSFETSLASLDLETFRWRKLAEGKDLFNPNYRWHYCAMNDEGTQAWLLGCPTETGNGSGEEYLSDVLPIDLRKLGVLGNSLTGTRLAQMNIPASDAVSSSHLSGIGADLACTFDQPPETGSGTDFIITGEVDDEEGSIKGSGATSDGPPPVSRPVHVHRLILQARWPHFSRMYQSQMLEFHTKKMHIPEPYSAVRAFLYYLYTDSIAAHRQNGPSLSDTASMLVMANMYDMPRLRVLCVNRLSKELDVEHAAIIWDRAGIANEEWLRRNAANFIMRHWGRVVRTHGFKLLPQLSLVELCEEVDAEGRIVGGDELEMIGGLSGSRNSAGSMIVARKRKSSLGIGLGEDETETEGQEADMEIS